MVTICEDRVAVKQLQNCLKCWQTIEIKKRQININQFYMGEVNDRTLSWYNKE